MFLTMIQRDAEAVKGQSLASLAEIDAATGFPVLPHWLAQPYFRPAPPVIGNDAEDNKRKLSAGRHDSEAAGTL